jgi:hypothetical protein
VNTKPVSQEDQRPAPEPYDPPQIEEVLTGEALAREVHYAGASADLADGSAQA